MKVSSLFILLFISLTSSGQQARIQKYFPKFEDKIDAALYTCSGQDRKEGMGVAEIALLDSNTVQIINRTPSHSLGGISITILLDSNLKVTSIVYKEWTDVRGGYKKAFNVESANVLLSFNPFKKGTDGLQGRYNFIIKTDYVPGEVLAQEGEKPSADFRIFNGRFKCD